MTEQNQNKIFGRILKSSKSTRCNTLYILKIKNKYVRGFTDDKYTTTIFVDSAFVFAFKLNAVNLKNRINNKELKHL